MNFKKINIMIAMLGIAFTTGCGSSRQNYIPTGVTNDSNDVIEETSSADRAAKNSNTNEATEETGGAISDEEFVPQDMYSISSVIFYGKIDDSYEAVYCEDYNISSQIGTKYRAVEPAVNGYCVIENNKAMSFYSYNSSYDRIDYDGKIYIPQSQLVSEKEYDDYKKLCDYLVSEKNIITDGNEETVYDDFNADGKKDLFYVKTTKEKIGCTIYYTDGEMVWETEWDDSMQEHEYGEYADISGSGLDVYTFGDYKVFKCALNIMSNYGIAFYIDVKEGTPKHVEGLWNDTLLRDKLVFKTWEYKDDELLGFNKEGVPFAVGDFMTAKMYPIVYEGGRFGECSYCRISEENFKKLKKADDIYAAVRDAANKIDTFAIYRLMSYDIKVKDSTIDSILYNDQGLFVFNCTLDTEIKIYSDDVPDGEYKDNPVVTEMGPISNLYDEEGNEFVTDIDKLFAHIYVAYDDGEISVLGYDYGRLEEKSGMMNTIRTSDFSTFEEYNCGEE